MATKRRMPVKTQKIQLGGEWDGWEFTARTNPSISVFDKLTSGDFHLICEALGECILGWNFVDEEGEPMLPPDEARKQAKAEFRANLNGDKPDRVKELDLMVQAGADAVGGVTFDLVVKVSEALSEAIAQPEKN